MSLGETSELLGRHILGSIGAPNNPKNHEIRIFSDFDPLKIGIDQCPVKQNNAISILEDLL